MVLSQAQFKVTWYMGLLPVFSGTLICALQEGQISLFGTAPLIVIEIGLSAIQTPHLRVIQIKGIGCDIKYLIHLIV